MAGFLLFRSTKERPVKNGKNLLASHNQTLAKLLGYLLALVAIGHGSEAAILTVTDTGDTIEIDGLVTLREAITSANNNADVNADVVGIGAYGIDTINFNIAGIGVHTIAPSAVLPPITDPVTIDGYTQPVARRIRSPLGRRRPADRTQRGQRRGGKRSHDHGGQQHRSRSGD